jgi:hypothetical protein
MKELEKEYSIEVDRVDKPGWHDLLKGFEDATFYQTWSYGERFWGARQLSHAVLRHQGRAVAAAQLRVIRFPLLRAGAAYLNWGPLWRRKGEPANAAHLRNMLRALFNEYVLGRNCALRVLPKVFDIPENQGIRDIFEEERYAAGPDSLRTFVVDLRPTADEIRRNLHRSWKRSLTFAEEQDLQLFAATDPGHFSLVAALNKEMRDRKQFYGGDVRSALEANGDLPRELRLRVLLCSHNGETIAALGWSQMGTLCLPIVSGTGDKALPLKASFLLFWRMVLQAKESGAIYCDTAGVHEKRNPGSYFFKKGLAGKDARETAYLGRFDAYRSAAAFFLFKSAMAARETLVNGARLVKARLK